MLLSRLTLLVLGALISAHTMAQWHSHQTTRYTTTVELVFWHDDAVRLSPDQIIQSVMQRFDDVDALMSSYIDDSDVSKVNQSAGNGPVKVSSSLFSVIDHAQRISWLSEGAFDISYASVGYFYDYRANKRPNENELKEGLEKVNFKNIILDKIVSTVFLERPGMRIDLGGVAKGYAVDLGIEVLKDAGVRHARLGAGGDMRLLGDKLGKPWIVGIQDPRLKDDQALVLPLDNVAVSTSGDYQRFFIADDGERVHHILSPKTGKPAKGIQSVTILGDSAMNTDALSTAVFVAGIERGLAMINRLPGIDAIIIDAARTVHYSDGLVEPK